MSSTPWSLKSSLVYTTISLHPPHPNPKRNDSEPIKKPTTGGGEGQLPVSAFTSGNLPWGTEGEGTARGEDTVWTISYQPGGLPVPLGSLLRRTFDLTFDRIVNRCSKDRDYSGF